MRPWFATRRIAATPMISPTVTRRSSSLRLRVLRPPRRVPVAPKLTRAAAAALPVAPVPTPITPLGPPPPDFGLGGRSQSAGRNRPHVLAFDAGP